MNSGEVSIEVTSRHHPVSDRMRAHATEKANKLIKFHSRITRVQFVINDVHEQPDVELIVDVAGGASLVSKERAEHFRAAVDSAVDKMERQLKKDQEKRTSHKGEPTLRGAAPPSSGDDRDEETYEEVVRRELRS